MFWNNCKEPEYQWISNKSSTSWFHIFHSPVFMCPPWPNLDRFPHSRRPTSWRCWPPGRWDGASCLKIPVADFGLPCLQTNWSVPVNTEVNIFHGHSSFLRLTQLHVYCSFGSNNSQDNMISWKLRRPLWNHVKSKRDLCRPVVPLSWRAYFLGQLPTCSMCCLIDYGIKHCQLWFAQSDLESHLVHENQVATKWWYRKSNFWTPPC